MLEEEQINTIFSNLMNRWLINPVIRNNDHRKFNFYRRLGIINQNTDGYYIDLVLTRQIATTIVQNMHEFELLDRPPTGERIDNFFNVINADSTDFETDHEGVRYFRFRGRIFAIPAMYIVNDNFINEESFLATFLNEINYYIILPYLDDELKLERIIADGALVLTQDVLEAADNLVPTYGQANRAPPDENQRLLNTAEEYTLVRRTVANEEDVLDKATDEVKKEESLNPDLDRELDKEINEPVAARQVIAGFESLNLGRLERSAIGIQGLMSRSGRNIDPIIFNDDDDDDDGGKKKPNVGKAFLGQIKDLMSLNRGPNNVSIPGINVQRLSAELVREMIRSHLKEISIFSGLIATFLGVSYIYVYDYYSRIYGKILSILGYTYDPSLEFNVQKFLYVLDKNKNILADEFLGSKTIQPEPISAQTSRNIIVDGEDYIVMRVISPIVVYEKSEQHKFLNKVDEYADNVLQQFTGETISYSTKQITYDFKDMVSVSEAIASVIENLYSTQKVDDYVVGNLLDKINMFLANNFDNVKYFLKTYYHVLKQYKPPSGNDDDNDKDDDDVGGGGDGMDIDEKGKQWFIMKTFIYWIVKNLIHIYDFTSEKLKHIAYIAFNISVALIKATSTTEKILFSIVTFGVINFPEETYIIVQQIWEQIFSIFSVSLDAIENVVSVAGSPIGIIAIGSVLGLLLVYKLTR